MNHRAVFENWINVDPLIYIYAEIDTKSNKRGPTLISYYRVEFVF